MTNIENPRSVLRHSFSSPNIPRISAPSTIATMQDRHSQALFVREYEKRQIDKANEDKIENYACNICFDIAENAVVTSCGHLHCWACLYRWMTLPEQIKFPTCPVCKSGCDLSSLTPIYGRGESSTIESTTPSSKARTMSTESQPKPKNILDQWLVPHIYPPTLPSLRPGETPARPVGRSRQTTRKPTHLYSSSDAQSQSTIFGGTHPVVIFSAGITTLCGMQILNNGGFTAPSDLHADDSTSKMMWVLAMAIIAGVWFH